MTQTTKNRTQAVEVRTLPRITNCLLLTFSDGTNRLVTVNRFIQLVIGKEAIKV